MALKQILNEAYSDKHAIGGFNFFNYESAKAIVQAAKTTKKPTILMVSEKSVDYYGLDNLIFSFNKVKKDSEAQIFLHLDHGSNLELIKECINSGFDSVMFDGSNLALDQNIALSKDLRKLAHKKSVVFEAEIGHIGGREDYQITSAVFKTNPAEALMFYDQVQPDMLAVAIGNIHGPLTAIEELDFSLLAKIQDTVKRPLVLHGCSNRKPQEYQVAISEGVVKINIDTELREAFVDGIKDALHKKENDPREILNLSSLFISKRTQEKIELFAKGCCSR
ncbi:MAG: class II fructose-bisphosphate aldolase [Candidatus Berkelbacteria bacterium]|nr:class II fructose-bisphosphate aldolase [Candidatus Berkelbacteria bacterium]